MLPRQCWGPLGQTGSHSLYPQPLSDGLLQDVNDQMDEWIVGHSLQAAFTSPHPREPWGGAPYWVYYFHFKVKETEVQNRAEISPNHTENKLENQDQNSGFLVQWTSLKLPNCLLFLRLFSPHQPNFFSFLSSSFIEIQLT